MSLTIQSSTDWAAVESILLHQNRKLKYRADILQMIRNIKPDIVALSVAELAMRRNISNNTPLLLNKINNHIELVESYILVAALRG